MTMTTTKADESPARTQILIQAAVVGIFAAVMALPQIAAWWSLGEIVIDDDAYYYKIVARNIVETGRSTFDGQSLTNGYHPLWQAIQVVQHLLMGESPALTLIVEIAMLSLALVGILRLLGDQGIAGSILAAACFCLSLDHLVLRGMETSAVIACFVLLLLAISRCREASTNSDFAAVMVGLAAAATVGARLDAAAFVLPILLLALRGRPRLVSIAVVTTAAVLFLVLNLVFFGTPAPVSATIKSLGGLQINRLLLEQISETYAVRFSLLVFLGVLCLECCRHEARGSWQRGLLQGISCGLVVYGAKVLFGSSWRIWDWYFYPTALAAIALIVTQARHVMPWLEERRFVAISAGVTVAACGAMAFVTSKNAADGLDYTNFRHINRLAVERYGSVLAGARVAMGDRAGSFSYAYRGAVVQTEGLVNDKAFLDTLVRGGDIRQLLCSRGVEFLLDYAPDLGDYRSHEIETLSPALTTFPAPTIRVDRRHEVGRVFDLAKYNLPKSAGHGDSYLYIWRLEGC